MNVAFVTLTLSWLMMLAVVISKDNQVDALRRRNRELQSQCEDLHRLLANFGESG